MDQPIACSLPTADYSERRATIDQIARNSLRTREPIEAGARLTFRPGPTTEESLRELIAAEAACCPFLHMELGRDGDSLTLDVTGPDEAQPLIAELFE